MSTLPDLITACQADESQLLQQTQRHIQSWNPWFAPFSDDQPAGADPGYDDDFQRIREEVNKLSGTDTGLICTLAEKLLICVCKDIRVATFYVWARLHQDGEAGFADGLELLAGLMQHFGTQLHPQRERSRKAALEWLAGTRVLDSLSLYPEAGRDNAQRITGALLLISHTLEAGSEEARPQLSALYSALGSRLVKAGGVDAVMPQNAGDSTVSSPLVSSNTAEVPALGRITSGQELLAQARTLAAYLRGQPDGWFAAHRLMKNLRHDTLQSIPAPDGEGKTRIESPRADQRALLKRLYLQQSWSEILERADKAFGRGANHLWLDLQWYIHEALIKSGQDVLADMVIADLRGLLNRLKGLETLAFNDGTPFADDVTLNWIRQQVLDEMPGWHDEPTRTASTAESDILALEPEALEKADSDGLDAALAWLQAQPGMTSPRDQWLLRLLMARVAEQNGKNEMALHLLGELDSRATSLTLTQWTPELMFEVKSRRLRLLRMKATRSETDKTRLQPEMDALLGALIALDPANAAVLCG